jgi:ABC-2 type transport system permease protein
MTRQPAAQRAVLALSTRLVRRGALVLAAAAGAYVALEVVSYERSYPDAASRAHLATYQDNPSVRIVQGLARNVDTIGGFVAWDGGWFLETVAGIWALLAVLRLTRGDEETDRSALLLAVPLPATRVLLLQLGTVVGAGVLLGATTAAALAPFGVPVGRAALFGLGLAGFTATVAGLAGVTAQLFDLRRRAVGAAAGLLALAYLLRMVANATDRLGWLRWASPYGWMDNLTPYGDPSALALLLLVVAGPVGTVLLATRLRARRDMGGATLRSTDRRRPHPRLLGSPVGFAWRSSRLVLLAWATGLCLYAVLIGSLLPSLTDFVLEDPGTRKALEDFGIDVADITAGMVSFMAVMYGLAFALFACWRIGAARTEEESGRADLLLARPLSRTRWLGGHLVLATGSVVLLAVVTGLSTWAGGAVVAADLTVWQALCAALNPLPAVLLFLALAVLLLGVRPRLTVALSASAAGVAYLLPVLGAALSLPTWVLDLSPFQHLAAVPARPYALTSGVVMTVLAVLTAVVGVRSFVRRDLVGA